MPLDVSGFEYAVGFMLATGVLHAVGISIGFLVGMATMLSGRWGVSLRSRTLPYVSEWLEEGKSARTAVHCEPMRCPPLRTDAMSATANRRAVHTWHLADMLKRRRMSASGPTA